MKKIWQITDWREIYELTDDVRKKRSGPLSYTKSQVSISGLSKPAEVKHFEMIKVLKSKPERHLLRSVFEDLTNWTGNKYYGPRGYLVTTEDKAASYEYLAAQLNLNVEDLKQAIPILEEIGLIEKVTLNGDLIPSGPNRPQSDRTGRSRKTPDRTSRSRTPLKKKKSFGKKKTKVKDNANALALANDKNKRTINNQQRVVKVNSRTLDKQVKKNRKTTTEAAKRSFSPTTTPPIMPKTSDAKGLKVIKFTTPSGSFLPHCERLGNILNRSLARNDPDAGEFAVDVYRALKLPWKIDSSQAKRELGSFRSLWMKAKTRVPSPIALAELRDKSVQEACIIARRRGRDDNPSAVWCEIFNRRLDTKYARKQPEKIYVSL